MVPTVIVGIDCATQPARVGLSRAELAGGRCTLTDLSTGAGDVPMEERVAAWLGGAECGLLAMDAPLGWPALLATSLPRHQAGEPLAGDADRLFHRVTDGRVRALIGRAPLEVGADRIARTAHAALALLGRIRERTGATIPLAWSVPLAAGLHAIEVYPAATLAMRDLPSLGYKRAGDGAPRERIVAALGSTLELGAHAAAMVEDADLLDSVVCVLAALDFLAGRCDGPGPSEGVARKEGWIWVPRRAGVPSHATN